MRRGAVCIQWRSAEEESQGGVAAAGADGGDYDFGRGTEVRDEDAGEHRTWGRGCRVDPIGAVGDDFQIVIVATGGSEEGDHVVQVVVEAAQDRLQFDDVGVTGRADAGASVPGHAAEVGVRDVLFKVAEEVVGVVDKSHDGRRAAFEEDGVFDVAQGFGQGAGVVAECQVIAGGAEVIGEFPACVAGVREGVVVEVVELPVEAVVSMGGAGGRQNGDQGGGEQGGGVHGGNLFEQQMVGGAGLFRSELQRSRRHAGLLREIWIKLISRVLVGCCVV